MMKKLLLAGVAGLAMIGMASAADLPARTSPPAFYAPPAFTWTGFYAGVNAGYSFGRAAQTISGGGLTSSGSGNANGFVGGIHAGVNYQIAPMFVLGIDGSLQYNSGKASYTDLQFGARNPIVGTADVKYLGTLVGKAGLAFDRVMLYGTAGYAGGHVTSATNLAGLTTVPGAHDWHNGYTIGGGVEYAVTNSWLLGVDYKYIRLSNTSTNGTVLFTNVASNVKPTINQVTARLSYKF